MSDPSLRRGPSPGLWCALGATAIAIVVLALGGAGAAGALLAALPWPVLWLASAWGWGWPVRRALERGATTTPNLHLQLALGVGVLLTLDALLGRLGLLAIGGGAGAWVVTAIGLGLLVVTVRADAPRAGERPRLAAPPPLAWTAAPAIAALLLAAGLAPGFLWASEFGGYDALSYHLELPKAWFEAGRIAPEPGVVYSHLPSYAEGAFLHIAHLAGDPVQSAVAAQLLSATLALAAAALVARAVGQALPAGGQALAAKGQALAAKGQAPVAAGQALAARGQALAAIAAVVVLGTPWVVVTGSLAYDETAVLVLLAGGLLVVTGDAWDRRPVRAGIALGLLAGAACGAKLTAAGLVGVPLAAALVLRHRGRSPLGLAAMALVATAVLLPWLVGNGMATGNPVFPFATGLLGLGPWTSEQAALWHEGHSTTNRLAHVWNEFLRYGLGPAPTAGEPWRPQWSILPWLALAGAILAARSPAWRRCALVPAVVLLVQVVAWALVGHVKSRFMLPAVAPAALLVACGAGALLGAAPRRGAVVATALALLAYAALPLRLLATERGFVPAAFGAMDVMTGAALADDLARRDMTTTEVRAIESEASLAYHVNFTVPRDARILAIGEAAPFYLLHPGLEWTTVWDRGPLSSIMRDDASTPLSARLASRGFTHALVNPVMLEVWSDAGWNDPAITWPAVRALIEGDERLRLVARDDAGGMLLEVAE